MSLVGDLPVLEYECRRCYRWGEWTDGTMADEDAGTIDEYWCQTCGNEAPLTACKQRTRPTQETDPG